LSDEQYAARRIATLRQNADFIGLSSDDLDALSFRPGSFAGSTENLIGTSARGNIRCRGSQELPGVQTCWVVVVQFQRDGVVSGFTVSRQGPPVSLCTTFKP
jgi:hypothetical protein